MNHVTRIGGALYLLVSAAFASDLVVSGPSGSGIYSTMAIGAAPVVAVAGAVMAPTTNGTGISTLTVAGAYSSVLSGTGPAGAINLSAVMPLTFSGYTWLLPPGQNITGATLNLDLMVGGLMSNILGANPLSLPPLNGGFVNLTIRISAGSVSKTISGTTLTSYDLFANGFGDSIANGAPLTITFEGLDNVNFTGGLPTQPVTLSEVRTLVGPGTQNFLTVYYASPSADMAPALAPAPEPASTGLVALGLILAGYLRFRRRTVNAR